uniref:Uncharacterized protein n=1 Tax=Meloidogyne enterolobii TaxID=390850 RepID=A0A6V7TKY2_MELEN|nr:unnamed protein product [Meloidogyne enterolobii]
MARRERNRMDELSGAEYLASIYGTEKDKVNCSFYFKIGACRHGEKCSRTHNIPSFSQTVLLKNMYHSPIINTQLAEAYSKLHSANALMLKSGEEAEIEQRYFEEFFEEVFTELDSKYGRIEEMNICDNIGGHMIGNVYVKFYDEEDAEACVKGLENRWFNGEPIYAELSPVTDFREACCRQYELGDCSKGAFCNFMHLKPISRELRRRLYGSRARTPDRFGKTQPRRDREWEHDDRTERDGGSNRRRSRSPRARRH